MGKIAYKVGPAAAAPKKDDGKKHEYDEKDKVSSHGSSSFRYSPKKHEKKSKHHHCKKRHCVKHEKHVVLPCKEAVNLWYHGVAEGIGGGGELPNGSYIGAGIASLVPLDVAIPADLCRETVLNRIFIRLQYAGGILPEPVRVKFYTVNRFTGEVRDTNSYVDFHENAVKCECLERPICLNNPCELIAARILLLARAIPAPPAEAVPTGVQIVQIYLSEKKCEVEHEWKCESKHHHCCEEKKNHCNECGDHRYY